MKKESGYKGKPKKGQPKKDQTDGTVKPKYPNQTEGTDKPKYPKVFGKPTGKR